MAFGDRALNNSIQCAKFYPLYSQKNETFAKDKTVDRSAVVYYSRVDAATTEHLQAEATSLADQLPEGWNGVIVSDPDGLKNLVVANLAGGNKNKAELKGLTIEGLGAPVVSTETVITDSKSDVTIALDESHSLMQPLTVFIKGDGVAAKMFNPWDDNQIYVRSLSNHEQTITVTMLSNGKAVSQSFTVDGTMVIRLDGGELEAYVEEAEEGLPDLTAQYIVNPNFEEDETWGTTGNITLGGTVYNPCYTQSVAAADSKFPQVLPVKGWEAASTLSPASKFALLYSMPYSFTQYCVSPSNIGNSASIMAVPAAFEESVGERCLSILNSWTVGTSAISQTMALPKGYYELSFKLRYACPNESRRTANNVIATTGGNVNTLLCGIVANGEEQYVPYPTAADTWETKVIGFRVEPAEGNETADVTIFLGLKTTENQGAANQTRLYIDDLRLRGFVEQKPDGINASAAQTADNRYYDLGGRQFHEMPTNGIVFKKGQKFIVTH